MQSNAAPHTTTELVNLHSTACDVLNYQGKDMKRAVRTFFKEKCEMSGMPLLKVENYDEYGDNVVYKIMTTTYKDNYLCVAAQTRDTAAEINISRHDPLAHMGIC